MRTDHRGFALIIVLLAAAAVFALVAQAAVIARGATIESRVMLERAEQERDARSAAVIVLSGLGTTVERFAAQTGAQSASSPSSAPGGGADPGEEERPRIELPQIVKDMLGQKAEELEEEAQNALADPRQTDGGGITGRAGRERAKLNIRFLPTEPVTLTLREGGPEYRVTLVDSSALLNVNLAERDQLVRYFSAKGLEIDIASQLASQIVDWRDEDNFAQPGGAEQDAYRERGIACRNKELQAIEELKYLPAMTPDIFDLVRGELTVAGDRSVHAPTAPPAVLRSLPGMDDESVRAFLEARRAGKLVEGEIDRVLPLYARASEEFLKFRLSGILRVRVEVKGETATVFEGLAVVSEKGIRAVGLRPLI